MMRGRGVPNSASPIPTFPSDAPGYQSRLPKLRVGASLATKQS